MIYIIIYLTLGFIYGFRKIPEQLKDTIEKTPDIARLATSPVKKHKFVFISILGIVVIFTLVIYMILWLPDLILTPIANKLKRGKK